MTREQIEAKWRTLSTRERDAWVAEAVFGLNVRFMFGVPSVVDFGFDRELDSYVDEIEGAWAVVETLKKRDYSVTVNTADHKSAAVIAGQAKIGDWHVCFQHEGRYSHAYAPTAPAAICLAALIVALMSDDR